MRGVPDYQSVPNARPLAPNTFVGPLYFELADTALVDAGVIYLDTQGGITQGDPIGVVLDFDQGAIFRTNIAQVFSGYITLAAPMPAQASAGNLMVDYRPGTNVPTIGPLLDSNFFVLFDSNGNALYPG